MKNKWLIVVIVLVVLLGAWVAGQYNSLVSLSTQVEQSYSNIEVQLQRRADLIPNLLNTVKGYIAHEEGVLTEIANARAKLAGASTVAEQSQANAELSSALSRLLVVVENYPTLKADTQFTSLMDELAGTENRIGVARIEYNDIVAKYNMKIRRFPGNIFANLFGFERAESFQADESSKSAPKVEF
ncbi:MAG: LemA family protein [Clostridiaceae bacterium]|nr:LemA family protein [Clostridiaceae bacterium]